MISSLETSKELRKQFWRLGRDGISQRINDLVLDFAKKHPDGHYKEAVILAGRLRALSLSARADSYWGEKTDQGFYLEVQDLPRFQKRDEGQD